MVKLDMNIDEQGRAISSVKLGLLAPANSYGSVGSRLTGMVLEQLVEFDPGRYLNARRAAFDVLVVNGPKMPMLSFVLYIEDARMHWLADPSEPAVWQAIDTWYRHGAVSVALTREETHTFRVPLRGELAAHVRQLQKLCNQKIGDAVALQAIEMFELGLLENLDHPNAPPMMYKSSCVLHTRRLDQAFKRLGYEVTHVTNGSKGSAFCARREVHPDTPRGGHTPH